MTAAELMVKIGADVSGAKAGLRSVNKEVAGFSSGAKLAAVAGAGAIALGVGAVVKGAADYQSSLNMLRAVTGANADQMGELSKKAIALGNDVTLPGTSAADAATAMTELAKGGLSVRDSMDAAKGVLQMSAAAGISNADAATIAARALNSFGLKGTEATRVADLLAAGANASTADMSDLALGMQAAGAVFHSSGQTIDTLTTSLGLMSNAGISGSDAGTSLKTMMMRLIPSTKSAAAEMKALGVKATDSHGNFLPLRDVISQYHDALAKLSPEQRQMALQTIFGSDAIRAANVMFGQGVNAFDKMHTAVEKHGAAADLANAKMQGFNGAIEAFKSTIETAEIVLGTGMLPVLTMFAQGLNTVAGVLMSHKSILEAVVSVVAAFAAPLLVAAGAVKVLTIATGALNLVMEANPIVLVIAALVALAVALLYAYNHITAFRNVVNQAFAYIKSVAAPVIAWLGSEIPRVWATIKSVTSSAWAAISGFFRTHWDTIKTVVTTALAVIKAVIVSEFNVFRSVVSTALSAIKAVFTAVWGAVGGVVKAALAIVSTVVSTQLNVIRHVVSAVLALLSGDWGKAWDELKQAAKAALSGLASVLTQVLTNLIPAVVAAAVHVGQEIVNGVLSGVGGLGSALKSKVEGMLKGALSSLNPFSPVKHGGELYIGKPIAEGAIEGYLMHGAALPQKISAHLRATLEQAKQTIDAQRSVFASAFERLAGDALKAFDARTDQLISKVHTKFDALRSAIDSQLNKKLGTIDAKYSAPTNAESALDAFKAQRAAEQENADRMKAQADLNAAIAADDQQGQNDARERLRQLDLDDQQRALETAAAISRDMANKMQAEAEQRAQAAADAKKKRLDAEEAQQVLDLQSQRDLNRRHLEDQLNDLETYLQQHPKKWAAVHAQIMGMFKDDFGPGMRTAGKNLGKAFAQGLDESAAAVHKSSAALAGIVQKYLKLNSPAETGPLSSLDTWWSALAPTLLSGANLGAIGDALAGATNVRPQFAAAFAGGGGLGGTFASGGRGDLHIHVHAGQVIGTKLDEAARELAPKVRDALNGTVGRRDGAVFAT
jgi:TP901 family phage tail tape measure protein